MSDVLDDCREQMGLLLEDITNATKAYELLHDEDEGEQLDRTLLSYRGVPLPMDVAANDIINAEINRLGLNIVKWWNEVYMLAKTAKEHCDKAAQDFNIQSPQEPPLTTTINTTPRKPEVAKQPKPAIRTTPVG